MTESKRIKVPNITSEVFESCLGDKPVITILSKVSIGTHSKLAQIYPYLIPELFEDMVKSSPIAGFGLNVRAQEGEQVLNTLDFKRGRPKGDLIVFQHFRSFKVFIQHHRIRIVLYHLSEINYDIL